MRYENSVMRPLERIAEIEKIIAILRKDYNDGKEKGLEYHDYSKNTQEINRLSHEKGGLLRNIGREVQLRALEGKTKVSLISHDWSEFDEYSRRSACARCGRVQGISNTPAECNVTDDL